MLVTIHHFYETTPEDSVNYKILWIENESRMVHLPIQLNESQQSLHISRDIVANPHKDILAIRSSSTFIDRNSIFRQIKNGLGFDFNGGKKWYPKEIWIY